MKEHRQKTDNFMKMAIGENLNDIQVVDFIGGADGSRTHDLLNAITSNLSEPAHVELKFPALSSDTPYRNIPVFVGFRTQHSAKNSDSRVGAIAVCGSVAHSDHENLKLDISRAVPVLDQFIVHQEDAKKFLSVVHLDYTIRILSEFILG
jgi:hypothetical protein